MRSYKIKQTNISILYRQVQSFVTTLLLYYPLSITATGAHPIEGGIFPPPPAASHLLTLLPPPTCFVGPFVKIDKFLENFNNITLPDGK